MRLWALTPVLTVLFLGAHPGSGPGATSGPDATSAGGPRAVLVADVIPAPAAQTPAPDPGPASLAPVTPSNNPVLQEQSDGTWQTTVLVTGATGGCPVTVSRYALDTTSPDLVLRNLGYPYFIGYPVGAGALLALTLLAWVLRYLRVYNRQGTEQKPFIKDKGQRSPNPGFWEHEVYASGAWTLTDSWATNIAAAIGVVTTLLSLVAAASLLFRGVDLSRFVIVNAVAAGIAAAAPLVFGVLYPIGTLADPEPGSTLSATTGSSFTL